MNVLVSAFACDPYAGSENRHGWTAVQCLAKDHDLWVLTGRRNRASLENAQATGQVPQNVRFIYAGRFKEWHRNRLVARFQSWKEYGGFSKSIIPIARELHRTVNFDLAHHVTFATWRVASPLWRLGIPFVLGPIGGNVKFPLPLLSVLSPSAAGFEMLRMLSNTVSRFTPSVRECIRNAAHVFTAESETQSLVTRLRGSDSATSWLMQSFYSQEVIEAEARDANLKTAMGPLRLFAGGNLIGAKGVTLALQALAKSRSKGVRFQYRVGGGGPELSRLQALVQQLGLEEEVSFGSWSGEAYRKELGTAQIYLLPSLRDGAPLTLADAMLAGCMPIVANCGGPGCIVTNECGYKIPVSTRETMIADLTRTIVTIDRNRSIMVKKGAAAAERIRTVFTEANYRKAINSIYQSVTSRAC